MRALMIVCVAGASTSAFAQSYSQPNTDLCERSFVSDAIAGQFSNRRQADDFSLNSTTQVNSIRWWGATSPFGGIFDLGNVDAFRIVIYEDNGGVPDSLSVPVYDQEFSKAQANPRETGFLSFQENAIQFEQTVQLPSTLTLNGGTRYWLTIGSRNTNPGGASWRWSSSLSGDFVTAQQTPFGGGWTIFDPSGANYAFEFNPVADGAICLPDGGCVIGTAEQAFTSGGLYQGDGTDCTIGCEGFAIFTQAPTQPCNPSFNSDAVPGQFAGTLSANNFEVDAASVINGVRWWGGSQFFLDFDLFNFESWTVTIYGSDSNGAPDESQILHAETFLQADTNPVLTPYRNRQNADLFEQSVTLSTPVAIDPNQRYWISIGTTNFDPSGDGWRWSASVGGDRIAASKSWTTNEFTVFDPGGIEYAFQLVGTSDGTGPVCTGDIADDFGTLGEDGQVSFGDFLALLGLIGPCPGGTPGCTGDIADDFGTIGGDGQVSFGDFLALLGLIGPCP